MNNLGGAHYSTERDRYSRRGSSIRSTRSDLGSRENCGSIPASPVPPNRLLRNFNLYRLLSIRSLGRADQLGCSMDIPKHDR